MVNLLLTVWLFRQLQTCDPFLLICYDLRNQISSIFWRKYKELIGSEWAPEVLCRGLGYKLVVCLITLGILKNIYHLFIIIKNTILAPWFPVCSFADSRDVTCTTLSFLGTILNFVNLLDNQIICVCLCKMQSATVSVYVYVCTVNCLEK